MTDAPGRIFGSWRGGSGWRFADCAETGCAEVRVYIRADLHLQALDAAREEGRRAGLEEAADWHDLEATHYGSACGQKDGVDFALVAEWHKQHAEAIRALIDKTGDPVAEAARVVMPFVPKEMLERLVISAGLDDMLSKCDECGAWFFIDEPNATTVSDIQGCWWSATRNDAHIDTCFRQQPFRMVLANHTPPRDERKE